MEEDKWIVSAKGAVCYIPWLTTLLSKAETVMQAVMDCADSSSATDVIEYLLNPVLVNQTYSSSSPCELLLSLRCDDRSYGFPGYSQFLQWKP